MLASIFISSSFSLFNKANPGAPGSAAIPASQVLVNLAIMLVDELFMTEAIIAYLGRHFNSTYDFDPAADWDKFRKNRAIIFSTVAVLALIPLTLMVTFPTKMCVTACKGAEEDWAMTSCPAYPTNITQMSRVGESFAAEFSKYN